MKRKICIAFAIIAALIVHDAIIPAAYGYWEQWRAERAWQQGEARAQARYDPALAARFEAAFRSVAFADVECGPGCGITGVTNSTLTLTGNNVAVSDPLTLGVINVSTNLFTTSTTAGQGEVVTSASSTAVSYGAGHIVLGATGSIIQANNGAVTSSNASPATGTCTEPLCAITTGSTSTATVFNITGPWSVLTASHLTCPFMPAVSITFKSVETGASVCTITFASAPAANTLIGTVQFVGNGT